MISRVLCRVERLLEQSRALTRPVLGLDTSTANANLALVNHGQIVATISRPVTSHGAALPGAVADLLAQAGIKLRDLGAIAIGIGPGSFTGLRIGLSYTKGLALASGCALIGVPSFDAFATDAAAHEKVADGTFIAVILDARKGEVYAALYRAVSDGLEKISEEQVVRLEQLASRITEQVRKTILLVGDQKAVDAAALIDSAGHRVTVLDPGTFVKCGASIAAIGAARLIRGETDRAATLEPLYIRTPEATYKPVKNPASVDTEGLWSGERKNSFGSM
ncbi:MAG: peptidase glycoprotease [Candidatus Binatus sp.]|nr:peptidase glycoprotease [Candidatus Binatus sp.]